MSELELLPEFLRADVRFVKKVANTKNECYVAKTKDGRQLFIKLHVNSSLAEVEFHTLKYIRQRLDIERQLHLNSTFQVPQVISSISMARSGLLIFQHYEGRTASQLLVEQIEASKLPTCISLIRATAHIHAIVSTYLDELNITSSLTRRFNSESDCWGRLSNLLLTEGHIIFSEKDVFFLRDNLTSFFALLFNLCDGFPCDYYKDANPANWVFAGTPINLIAVDFEGTRTLPFVVDILNITEYASDYLTRSEKLTLLDCYLHERSQIDSNWSNALHSYDLKTIISLWGIVRHQEQMLHRVRDIVAQSSNASWHRRAFRYHLSMVRSHIAELWALRDSRVLSNSFFNQLNEVSRFYESSFNNRFKDV